MHSEVRIFKFGGASVNSAEAVRNVAEILRKFGSGPLVVVISAMGKTTNALEEVVWAYLEGGPRAMELFEKIKVYHWGIASELFEKGHPVFDRINDLFVEVEWILEEPVQDNADYLYDQIVSIGELISTHIVSAYLVSMGMNVKWIDARDLIHTDEFHREARIDWPQTRLMVGKNLAPLLSGDTIVITQGFIGSTADNVTTTLGREGSDYTAAILANCLDAREAVIWKDVRGILTADPARFENVDILERLTYREAIEMTYYGAKVLHPKTIKPLQNKQIPLYVRSFIDHDATGTWIGTDFETVLPPVIIVEENQALVQISTRDFSFVAEHHLSRVFETVAALRIKINMMRNSAISFLMCCNDDRARLDSFMDSLKNEFQVVVDHDVKLFTIRHADQKTIDSLLQGHSVLLEERFRNTYQYVVKATPAVKPRNP